jgi:hypothetical protein
LGKYVIRKLREKIRRVWVQPTWVGRCSPRKFTNEQCKLSVLNFLKCPIKVQVSEERDLVREFVENPYFLRPQFLPSGRVNPEIAQQWRVEDSIESSKEMKNWSSVEDRIKRRRRERHQRSRELGNSPIVNEEISYLTVDCDFQEVDVTLPERVRRRSPERGFHFAAANSREPIEGPKTLEEHLEDLEAEWRTGDYMKNYRENQVIVKPREVKPWDRWVPKAVEIEEYPTTQVTVTASLDDLDFYYQWQLRRGMHWADFKFLVNSVLGRDDWEAYTNNYIWNREICNDTVTRAHHGQLIRVTPEGHQSPKLQERLQKRKEAWERILDQFPDESDWTLSSEEREETLGWQLNYEIEDESPYIIVEVPDSVTLFSIQVPKGNEWAYFTAFMDDYLGDGWKILESNSELGEDLRVGRRS